MSILDEIAAHKRQEGAEAQARLPLTELERAARAMPPPRTFRAALEAGGNGPYPAVIAEIKRHSPAKGVLRADADPAALAVAYAGAGAAALSVLTDRRYFHGSLADLQAARAAVGVPVLCKDFLLDPFAVFVARAAGADSVLLIVAILAQDALTGLLTLARDLDMEPLVEVHTAEEMRRAADAGAAIIGINNRDLHTFAVDLATTERLAPLAPPGVLLVGLSGIATPADSRRMAAAGARAVLVGEALVTAPDPAARLRALRGLEVGGWELKPLEVEAGA